MFDPMLGWPDQKLQGDASIISVGPLKHLLKLLPELKPSDCEKTKPFYYYTFFRR